MSKKYVLIDGNSLGHFANNGRKLSLGEMEVGAIYNFLRAMRNFCALYNQFTPIVLWDGASWRKQVSADYKADRESTETKAQRFIAQRRDAYQQQVPKIRAALRLLGVNQLFANNMEADDLAAILVDLYTRKGSSVLLLTGDQDWLQLVGPGVVWKDFIKNRMVTHKTFEEFTGFKTPRAFVEGKALMGDAGDGVPGVGGVGAKGAQEFLAKYGSFNDFLNQALLEKTIDVEKLPKKYRALIEDEQKAIRFQGNLELVDLRTPVRPAPEGMSLDKGAPDRERFKEFCDELLFQSITQNLDDWLCVFPKFNTFEPA